MEKKHINIGGDPRLIVEYGQLRDEINKLMHPARPDIDWQIAEQLSLILFRNNGIELQTLAWYILSRLHNAGLHGLAEGFELLDALLTHHWTTLWPQQTHARLELLAWLSTRLQQQLRQLTLTYSDLPLVYRSEQSLKHSCEVLQRLELKTLSKLEVVAVWLHNAALRLEKAETEIGLTVGSAPGHPVTINSEEAARSQLIFVVKEAVIQERRNIADKPTLKQRKYRMWQALATGTFLGVLVCIGVMWGITHFSPPDKVLVQPLPSLLAEDELVALRQSDDLEVKKTNVLALAQQHLDTLHQLSPLWSREYALGLTQQLITLWPDNEQVVAMAKNLQKQLTTETLPDAALQNWHQAQKGLEALTAQLNALDERKGRYLTGSELKSAIFSIRHHLDGTPPPEELLRQIEEIQAKQGNIPPALLQQLDTRLQQLLNRYILLKQQTNQVSTIGHSGGA